MRCVVWSIVQCIVCSVYGPAEEVGLLDVGGGVAVATVSVFVVETALSQDDLLLWD